MNAKRSRILTGALAALVLTIPAAAHAAPVRVGQSGWTWGDPRPQGNAVRALAFAGTTGFAVGDFGTALRTDDGGATWTGLPTGTTDNLTEVRAISPSSVVVGGGCEVLRSDDGGQTFHRLAFTPTAASCPNGIAGLAFPTPSVGYFLLSNGNVLSTADGGQTFQRQTAVPGTSANGGAAPATDVDFTDATHGVAVTAAGVVYRTADGGGSWQSVASADHGLNAVRFANATVGYAVGSAGEVLRTDDAGVTWTPRTVPGGPTLSTVSCADAQTCVFATADGKALIRTTDGGATFASVTPATQAVHTAAFASATRVVAAGDGGATRISDDAGQTFPPVQDRLGDSYSDLAAGPEPATAFAFGPSGSLARTADGGATWKSLAVPTDAIVESVSFQTDLVGYALDSDSNLFGTVNGGTSWASLDTGTSTAVQDVVAAGNDVVLLVSRGGVRRSTDGGGSFSAVRATALTKLRPVGVDRAGSAVVVFGPHGLSVSTDRGAHWKRLTAPPHKPAIDGLDFVTAKAGYLIDTNGRLWSTRNGGKRWTLIAAVGTGSGYRLAFSSMTHGWVALSTSSSPTTVLRTDDGGKSFRPQIIGPPTPAPVLLAPGPSNAYALGGGVDLLATTGTGDAGTASTLTIKPSKKRLTKAGFVTIRGTLGTYASGEHVTVSELVDGKRAWRSQTATVAATGRFSIRAKLTRGATFVAQWTGDASHAGDGTTALHVAVGRHR